MRELSIQQMEEVLSWVCKFTLSRPNKKLNRDFSDAVLLAEILKQLYPKIVELHNYPSSNAFANKMHNWATLNRKVLKKIGLEQSNDTLVNLAKGIQGMIESLLYDIMVKAKLDALQGQEYEENNFDSCTDIMMVNVQKRNGDVVTMVPQKMILYSIYQKAEETIAERNQAITILTNKIQHLEKLLELRTSRISDLICQLTRNSRSGILLNREDREDLTRQDSNTNSSPSLLL